MGFEIDLTGLLREKVWDAGGTKPVDAIYLLVIDNLQPPLDKERLFTQLSIYQENR